MLKKITFFGCVGMVFILGKLEQVFNLGDAENVFVLSDISCCKQTTTINIVENAARRAQGNCVAVASVGGSQARKRVANVVGSKALCAVAKLYCGQPGTGKTTLLRKLYAQYNKQDQVILCPTNQLIQTYQMLAQQEAATQNTPLCHSVATPNAPLCHSVATTNTVGLEPSSMATPDTPRLQVATQNASQLKAATFNTPWLNTTTLYHLLKLTPKTIPSKHLKNFGPLHKDRIHIPRRIYIDEVFMFSYQEMWALLKCIQIKQHIQKTLSPEQPIEIYMFGDPFQLKCTATSIAQQTNLRQGGDGTPMYWYHAFKDFGIDIETEYLQKLHRFDEEFGKYISGLKQQWRNQILNQETNKLMNQKLPFDVVSVDSLKKYISQGYVILVGTHRARTYYQQKIFSQFKNTVFYAKDGKKYRLNGPVYTLSETGQSYQKRYLIQNYNQINGEFTLKDEHGSEIIVGPKYKNKTSYQLAPGDVLTVNVVQGRELPGVIIDMQSLFEFGSFYTAISRCKKIQDVKLVSVAQMQCPDLQNEFVLTELLSE